MQTLGIDKRWIDGPKDVQEESTLSLDTFEMARLWVPLQVAQIISFVWNQNLAFREMDIKEEGGKNLIEFKLIHTYKQYENSEEFLKLVENGLDAYELFCKAWKNFKQLDELNKHILIYTWKAQLLGEEISEDLEVSICPAEVAKCVTHYKNYEFQKFHDITDALIQEQLW
mgnify:FL=1